MADRLQPDIVILDVEMPLLDGFAVGRALKASPSPPLILFLTLHVDAAPRAQGAASGADGYVEKSAGGSALLAALRATLDPTTDRKNSRNELGNSV
jgi:DNA-binding response OmpR family regulator